MIANAFKGVVGGLLLSYPVAVYFAEKVLSPSQLLAGLVILLGLRMLVAVWINKQRVVVTVSAACLLLAAGVAALCVFPDIRLAWLRFYPMVFDLAVFGVFFGSLFVGQPVIERIARVLGRHEMTTAHIRYARRATWAWAILMLLIALVSLYTAVATSLETWSLFNGVIVYGVMGAMLAGEYLLRRRFARKWEAA